MEPGATLLGTATRPTRPWPRLTLVALAAGVAVAAVLPASERGPIWWFDLAAKAIASLAACSLASWVEERLYSAAAPRAPLRRLAAAFAVPPLGGLAFFMAGALLAAPLGLLGRDASVSAALVTGGFWFGLAGVGSLTVVVLDVLVSAVVKDFRSRIVLAVLGLVALSTTFATAFALGAAQALGYLAGRSGLPSNGSFSIGAAGNGAAGDIETLVDEGTLGPLVAMLACGAGVVALPILLSACSKLADAVMERLHPLSRAFSLVTAGELGVRVEEGGSEDFVKLSRDFNAMVGSLALAKAMDRAYGAYLGKQVAERLKAQHGEAALPASSRVASVFFADIRGFTSMSEKLEPAQVLGILNRYFERVVAAIDAHEGYLNKFIGDAVVVVFNAPLDQPDHAAQAVRCAIAIQEEVARLNAEGAFAEVGGLRVGIGVASGPVVAGNLGSQKQMEYTVIGDTVNLASRLTGKAAAGEVWVNAANAAALPADMPRVELPPFQVKGKEQPVAAFKVWPRGSVS